MSNEVIFLLIIGGVIVFLIILYNRLVKLRQNRNNSFSDIDIQLKQRYDLVPQLLETVKGYAKHESELLEKVTQMRANINPNAPIAQRAVAEAALGSSMMTLFAVAENYPDLKADANFMSLQSELSDIENKIAAARRFFNNATNELNTACEQFPSVLIAKMFGFKQESFFDVSDAEKEKIEQVPQIKF